MIVLKRKAIYSSDCDNSLGRLFVEDESKYRTSFQRDKDRVIHSEHFRLLKHKTQVFIAHTEDYYRTRLTHSLEVSQIARTISRKLSLDEDLSEVIALAHDIGHPPFAHSGEEVLNECMRNFGGFDHNSQTLKILTKLEKKYPSFDGLNLTWETLEGVLKHNGPLITHSKKEGDIPKIISDYIKVHDLEIHTFPSLEAQVASLSDDIAYNNHDIDDGFRAKFFNLKDLRDIPIIDKLQKNITKEFVGINESMCIQEVVRRLIGYMVDDLINETNNNLKKLNPMSVKDIRNHNEKIASFSVELVEQDKILRKFLREKMYNHPSLERDRVKSRKIIRELFNGLMENTLLLPADIQEIYDKKDKTKIAYTICDYIASMTDRSIIENHAKITDTDEFTAQEYLV